MPTKPKKEKQNQAEEVRIGVIGMGNMGAFHSRVLSDNPPAGLRLTAVCDQDAATLRPWHDLAQFSCASELIRSGLVDAVLIATPHYSHVPIGIDALRAGLHVLMEKPLAVHKADAQKLLKAHTKKSQVFAAMFNQRTDPHYQKVRELVQSGELGPVQRVQWTITDWFRTEAYYNSSDWRATWAGEGGGVLINQSVHNLDLLQWIFGMPTTVRAVCGFGKYHAIEVEDEVSAILEFPGGFTGTYITSSGEAPGSNRLEIAMDGGRLILENGTLKLRRNEVFASKFLQTSPEGYARPGTWEVDIPLPSHRGEQHRGILENFTNAILHGEPLIAPASEGLASVELINAMLWSGWEDRTVTLPLSASKFAAKLQAKVKSSRPPSSHKLSDRSSWSTTHHFGTT